MKTRIKRWVALMMISAAPMVSAEPISSFQDSLPPHFQKIEIVPQTVLAPEPPKALPKIKPVFGIASWYSQADPYINLRTANGDIFDDTRNTCASWHYPFGTRLRITNEETGKSIVCIVNDRGPAKRLGRVVDLTVSAFKKIANPRQGLVRVSVEEISN